MKSLIALIIVILSVVGMIGAVVFALNFRSVRNQEALAMSSTQLDDVVRIEFGSLPQGTKPLEVNEPRSVREIVGAFKKAKISYTGTPDEMKYIDFIYKDNRPPFRMWFSAKTAEQRFGGEVAQLIEPFVRQLDKP